MIGCAVGVVAVGAVLTMLLLAMERQLIYFPDRHIVQRPREMGLESEELWLRSADGVKLRAWWVHGSGQRVLLFFHGNAGNISHRLERVRLLVDALGLDVVLLDYRGYGESEGTPSEAGLYADGLALYQLAIDRGFRPEQVVLFGESLGSAVAIETALHRPCRAVILETPFLSVPALARRYYPWVPPFLIRTRFDNERKIPRLKIPKLIVAAERDEIVPPEHARKLFELAALPKELYVIPGATHNDTYLVGGRAYIEAWKRFLDGISAREESSVPSP